MPSLKPQLPAGAGLASAASLHRLADRLANCMRITVLSGAGISTESGLSDYRSPGKPKPSRPPINHHEYIKYPSVRRLYWARSFVGYPVLSRARPGLAHHALNVLHSQNEALFHGHVTQNVDGLLQRAGMEERGLVELHGSIHGLYCRHCGGREGREGFQERLMERNAGWSRELENDVEFRADGDAELAGELVGRFRVPECVHCGADELMPAVVFHGGGVPIGVAERAAGMVAEGDGLLVVGSTVQLWSAWRLVRMVKERGGRVFCVNFGRTRGDDVWDEKVEGVIGDAVVRLARIMGGEVEVPEYLRNVYAADDDGVVRTLQL
eukprot:GFKZ01000282.1.p1 GENE.GFKZ01000282.1~~GFKZ01000282.1.p1  ORF type:complete len:348 (+),score=23.20 GFKZ01000282.1:73-1044(+)